MKVLGCPAVRRRLHAFHDEELQVGDQIAVGAHLEWCDECAASIAELRMLRAALRGATPGRAVVAGVEDEDLETTVMRRLRAEQTAAIGGHLRDALQDRDLVYSVLTAVAATVVCVMTLFGMMRLAADVHPDSLAAMIKSVPPPGSNENPVPINAYVMMPWALDQAFSTATNAEDGDCEFMITAVVTREGTVTNLELHQATSAKAAQNLMGAVSRARFEPARVDGLPVAVSMVWLVMNTTVRANATPALDVTRTTLDPPPQPAKRRVV